MVRRNKGAERIFIEVSCNSDSGAECVGAIWVYILRNAKFIDVPAGLMFSVGLVTVILFDDFVKHFMEGFVRRHRASVDTDRRVGVFDSRVNSLTELEAKIVAFILITAPDIFV